MTLSSLKLTFKLLALSTTLAIQSGHAADSNTKLASTLYESILNNDRDTFTKTISLLQNLNIIGNPLAGESLLCAATKKNREFFLQKLLEFGADPNHNFNEVSSFNQIPILCAVSEDNLSALKLLHLNGADLNATTNPHLGLDFQRSALAMATILGKFEHAEYIMERTEIDDFEIQAINHSINKRDYSQFPIKHALSKKFEKFLASGSNDYAEFSRTYQP